MADQSNDHQMEDAQNLAGAADKGKGKAPQVPDAAMESAEDDSSDESGAEADVSLPLILLPVAQTLT